MTGIRWTLCGAGFPLVCGVGLVLVTMWPLPEDAADNPMGPDEEMLQEAKVGSDAASMLAYLRLLSAPNEDLKNLDSLIRQLGHDDFVTREAATQKLVALGLAARTAALRATTADDQEVRRRAQTCVEQIDRQMNLQAP
jgi:hypothetical protein